jgi:flagellin-specific chaperone FliS
MDPQEEIENAADNLGSNYEYNDEDYDDELNLDDDYLNNYENELNYGDVLGQFLEDEDGKNISENLADLIKVMKEIKDVLKLAVTKNSNAIDQNSKCIIKLQKTIESIVIDNTIKK